MEKKLSERISVLGFLMTCVIAVYHVGTPGNPVNAFDMKWNTFIGYVFDTLAVLAMSHFFAVTGYLLFYKLDLENYQAKIKKRVYSLFLPYCVWQIIITIKAIILGGAGLSLRDFICRVFLLQKWPPVGALWYLYAVFILAFFSPILLFLFKNKRIGLALILAIVVLGYRMGFMSSPAVIAFQSYGYMGNILSYFPSYIVGAYCGIHSEESSSEEQLRNALAVVFIAMVFDGLYNNFLYGMSIRMMPIFLLYLFPVLPCMKKKRIYKLSFLVYAVHGPVISDFANLIRNIISKVTPYAIVSNLGTRIICLCIDFVVAGVLFVALKRFAPKVLNVLMGGRS